MDNIHDDTFKNDEHMPIDTDGIWRKSCSETHHTISSSSRELINNVKVNNSTTIDVNLEYVLGEDSADKSLRMGVIDNGRGFKDDQAFANSWRIADTIGIGNNNYGMGHKSPAMLNKDFALCMGTSTDKVTDVKLFTAGKNQIPKPKNLTADHKKKILSKFKGHTFNITILTPRIFLMPIEYIIDTIVSAKTVSCDYTKCIENTNENSLEDQFSISYCDLIKKGNIIKVNKKEIIPKPVINPEHKEIFGNNKLEI